MFLDDVYRYINETAEALYRIGAVDPLVSCVNCSWILIGRNGLRKSWVQQEFRKTRMGPATIDVDIPLEGTYCTSGKKCRENLQIWVNILTLVA